MATDGNDNRHITMGLHVKSGTLLILVLIGGLLGLAGHAGDLATIGKILLVALLILLHVIAAALIVGLCRGRRPAQQWAQSRLAATRAAPVPLGALPSTSHHIKERW